MTSEFTPIFVTKGPLDPEKHKHLYISRQEDTQAMSCITTGTYVALLGARQTGKTSLLYMLRHRLLEQGTVRVAMVDLSGSMYKPEGWYSFVCRCMLDELGVAGKTREELLQDPDPAKFDEFLKVVAAKAPGKKVILFDEIGAIPLSISEPFLWTIRSVFNSRLISKGQPFAQYVFVLAGSYDLQQLTKGKGIVSPFNISKKIYMTDLPTEGAQKLIQILGESGFSVDPGVHESIYAQTGGHPYLTQRLCRLLEAMGKELAITPDSVKLAMAKMLEGDDCLAGTIDRLKDNSEIETLAKHILLGQPVRFDRNQQEIVALELAGTIKRAPNGNCVVRNLICETALRRHFKLEGTVPTSTPARRTTSTSWWQKAVAMAVAASVCGATYFLSKHWGMAVLTIPLLWLASSMFFYLKDIKLKDITNDPERVLNFEGVTVEGVYNPVLKSNQEHNVFIQVCHQHPERVQEVRVTVRPLSRNLAILSSFNHTYTLAQQTAKFTLVLGRRATLWTLVFPFTEKQLVEFSAQVGNERQSGLIKLNADYTSSLVLSAIASVAGLVMWGVELVRKIVDIVYKIIGLFAT